MIDMKAMLADREAGTPGQFCNFRHIVYTKATPDEDHYAVAFATDDADARRFARVPELEQALIDARAEIDQLKTAYLAQVDDLLRNGKRLAASLLALAECADYFEDRADTIDGIAPNRAGTL